MKRAVMVVVFAALALGAVLMLRTPQAPPITLLLPGLKAALPTLESFELSQSDTTLTLRRESNDWLIEDARWPADQRWLQPLLLGLAEAHCDEPRTALSSRFSEIGVDWPRAQPSSAAEEGFAQPTARVSVVINGTPKSVVIGFARSRGGTFVRVEGDPSSCFTRTDLRLPAALAEWFEPRLLTVPMAEVETVQLDDVGATPLRLVVREGRAIPEGQPMALTPLSDALVSALLNLRLDRVLALGDAPEAQRTIHLSLSGERLVRVALWRDGSTTWASLQALGGDAEWMRFAQRLEERRFSLPPDVADPLWASRASLSGSN